jgi:hypothetical protein
MLHSSTPISSETPIPPELVCPLPDMPKETFSNGTVGEEGCGLPFKGTSVPAEVGSGVVVVVVRAAQPVRAAPAAFFTAVSEPGSR